MARRQLGCRAAALPALWRGRSVVELGCGTGYVGLLLAQLGARVTLTDLPKFQEAAAASILATGPHIQPPGRASFCCLDWADVDANARALLKSAHVLVAAEPVTCQCSERDFLSLLEAVLGGGSLLCPRLEGFLVAHKHQQNFCIGGYSAPSREAAPGIVLSDSCDRCTFRRKLQDAGASIGAFAIEPPREFAHPFVECWEIRLPWR
ncbi:eef1akmt3 [Symbiodinium necroappetens]|uniref:Eef1akmt3 protein n=1 Tax=Symbiodinium necroappetens TaxID=1628268 RepID=A0A812YTM7_9DINO|nr:eef1akmt3 [Symbiodinium necroappetens]